MKVGTDNALAALRNVQSEMGSAKEDPFSTQGKKGPRDEKEKIKEIANEFESLFLGIVLKSMRETVSKSGLMDGGNAEDIYKSMLDTEYTKSMASQRSTGIADNIEKFLLDAVKGQERTTEAMQKIQDANGRKAYAQLQAPGNQATIAKPAPSKARQPQ